MYTYNHGTHSVPPGHTPNAVYGTVTGYPLSPAFAPPPGIITATPPAPAPAPGPGFIPGFIPSPSPVQQVAAPSRTSSPTLLHVQVPSGCYPIELVQFWQGEYKHGQPLPLHWALFLRTSPTASPTSLARGPGAARAAARTPHARPNGNFYELVGTPETYTAQFLAGAPDAPESHPDWRGTHVIGWVHPDPGAVSAFERVVRGVQVWRRRSEWRCQHWTYEVVCALATAGQGQGWRGVYVDGGVTWAGLQRRMGRLLEAWENGDI